MRGGQRVRARKRLQKVERCSKAAAMGIMADISAAGEGAPCSILEPDRFLVRDCNGSDSDARALVEFDGRMSAELLGNKSEDRLSLSFLQQVRGTLRPFMYAT